MGTGTFFSKLAGYDPLAQALHLPGSNKYAQQQASQAAGNMGAQTSPYAGVTPTLAGANAGYVAGGPGSIPGTAPLPAQGYVTAARNASQQQQPNYGNF
jgi:hypothetical protein